MTQGTQHSADDPRNADILISINGEMKHRSEAMVSVFDSGFVLGDGVWEGFRVVGGHPVFLDAHLDRLYEGAKAIMLDIGLDRTALTRAIYDTLDANGMRGDGVHVRLMVTRGVKSTPYQDPRVTVGPATIVIIPEYKIASVAGSRRGLSLYTVHVRRGFPDVQDPKLNSHSKLNCITACIQATEAGADEALISGDDAVTRIKDMTKGQGAEVVLDLVGVTPTLTMAAQISRVLGHLTIVGLGNAALPVNFHSPAKECSVAAPFWGTIPELIDVISLAQSGKIKMLVEHFALDDAAHAYHLLHNGKIQGRAVITPND